MSGVVITEDWSKAALAKVMGIASATIGEYSADVAKMAAELERESEKGFGTGQLAASFTSEQNAELGYAVTSKSLVDGHDHAAHIEWGTKHIKGTHATLRAQWGMKKRYARGEKWRD